MKKMAALMIIGFCLGGMAETRTWTGGGSDSNWSTPANWGGTAPVAGDTLFFGGTSRLTATNDFPEGTAFAGITFNSDAGAFAISGNRIALNGDITSLDNSYQTFNLPLELSGNTIVSNSVGGGRIVINGHISGSGGFLKDGTEFLQITASNSYEGATVIRRGSLIVNNAWALGATNGITSVDRVVENTGTLIIEGNGMEIYEAFEFRNLNSNGNCFINRNGSNTLHGAFTIQGGRYRVEGGATCVLKKGVARIGNPFFVLGGQGTYIFDDKVDLGTDRFYADDSSKAYLNAVGNLWSSAIVARGEVIMNAVNVLPANSFVGLALNYAPLGTLNLNGHDQTIRYIHVGTLNAGDKIVKSDTPAILTLTDSGTHSIEIDFKGAVGLRKGGSGNLTLTGDNSDTTGSFIVDAGTLTVANGSSLGKTTNAVVNSSAVLDIKGSAALTSAAVVSVNGSGSINLASGVYAVADTLRFDGVEQSPGEWGSSVSTAENTDDTHFQGEGIMVVTGAGSASLSNRVWDAEGADANFSTPENWAGDEAPAFDGFDRLIFGSGGSSAVVDSVVGVYGLAFNRTSDFTVADGAGTLKLGAGGILAESVNAASRTYTIVEDLVVNALNSRWQINRNGASSVILKIDGDVGSAAWNNEIRVAGNGGVNLSGDNSFAGGFVVETGCVVNIYHNNALGATNGATVVANGGLMQIYGGIEVRENIEINGDAALSYSGALRSNGGSNVWRGVINCRSNSRVRCNGGSLDILGGVIGSQFVVGANSGTYIRIAEKPVSIGANGFYPHSGGGPIIIAVTNNTAAQANVNGSELRFDVPNAFNANILWDISNSGGIINLNGNDQEIGRLQTRTATPSPGTGQIYSVAPATLTVRQNANADYRNAFEGALSVVKRGSFELRLYDTHSTTGTLTVAEGTLTLKAGCAFEALPLVSVTGGTLALENDTSISDAALLSIESGGVVAVGGALTEEVGWLRINGTEKRAGTYGAAGSGAQYIDSTHFSGTGLIKVLHDNSGTIIIIR